MKALDDPIYINPLVIYSRSSASIRGSNFSVCSVFPAVPFSCASCLSWLEYRPAWLHTAPMSAVEIICSSCGADTLLNREAVYDGFTKTGEKLVCSSCGFEYASETEVPFKVKKVGPQVFTEADRSVKVEVFDEGENKRICRYCANYTVNPFTQFCAIHKKEVQATDTCENFSECGGMQSPTPL